jgi:hypothetical protein
VFRKDTDQDPTVFMPPKPTEENTAQPLYLELDETHKGSEHYDPLVPTMKKKKGKKRKATVGGGVENGMNKKKRQRRQRLQSLQLLRLRPQFLRPQFLRPQFLRHQFLRHQFLHPQFLRPLPFRLMQTRMLLSLNVHLKRQREQRLPLLAIGQALQA